MKKALIVWLSLLLFLALPVSVAASVGVGVGTGRIAVAEKLRSGGIYTLPPVTVFNTGTEPATYTMDITLNEKQDQLKPNPAWFSFSPRQFTLSPKNSQIVTPTVHPPLRTNPGEYFAYIEAHPTETVKQGTATVGVAAATKLSFSVTASNIFTSLFYRLLGLYRHYQPWSQIGLLLLALGIAAIILSKFINLRAAVKAAWGAGRKHKKEDD